MSNFYSGSDLKMMHEAFKEMDRDRSGRVSLQEMKDYMRRFAPHLLPSATSLFNKADVGDKGSMTFERLMYVMYPSASPQELKNMIDIARPFQQGKKKWMDPEVVEDITDIFRIYDDNGDNTLDIHEFCSAIMMLGWSESDARQIFREIDIDSSSLVSLEEFIQWFADHGTQCHAEDNAAVDKTDSMEEKEKTWP